MQTPNQPPNKRGKPFQLGNDFGKGRPAGSRNKATLIASSLLEGEAEEITRKVIEMAKAGDLTAIRLCMDRLVGPCRERHVQLDLHPVETAEDVSKGYSQLLAAVAQGELTVNEGLALAEILSLKRQAIETEDLSRRLKALETQQEGGDVQTVAA